MENFKHTETRENRIESDVTTTPRQQLVILGQVSPAGGVEPPCSPETSARLGSVLGGQPGEPRRGPRCGEGLRPGSQGPGPRPQGLLSCCVQPLWEGLLSVFDGSLIEGSKSNCLVPQQDTSSTSFPQCVSVFLLSTLCEQKGTGTPWPPRRFLQRHRGRRSRGPAQAQLSHRTVGVTSPLCLFPHLGDGDDNPIGLTGLLRGIEASGNKGEELREGAGRY